MDVQAARERRQRLWFSGKQSSEKEIVPQHRYLRETTYMLEERRRAKAKAGAQRLTEMEAAWAAAFAAYVPTDESKITVQKILAEVAKHYGVSQIDIKSARRTANITLPRHVVFYLSRTLTTWSLPRIGMFLGKRDHTTVLHGFTKIKNLMTQDPALAEQVRTIQSSLEAA